MKTLGQIKRDFPSLPRLVALWQEGELVAGGSTFSQLEGLLREHHSAREYFCEAMQIDAEVKQRMGSRPKVASALTSERHGEIRPAARILVNSVRFADDEAFRSVYRQLEESETHAQVWLRLYPAACACAAVCCETASEASAAVEHASSDLAKSSPESLGTLTVRDFRESFVSALLDSFATRTRFANAEQSRLRRVVIRVLMNAALDLDSSALYRSIEAVVPRHISVDRLRPLSMCYLLGRTPQQAARELGVPAALIRRQLNEVRAGIWLKCAAQPPRVGSVADMRQLVDLLSFFDSIAPDASEQHETTAQASHSILKRLESDPTAASDLLALAIINQALYETLTLPRLLEQSKSRKERQYHDIITEMIGCIERDAVPKAAGALPVREAVGGRRLGVAAGLIGAAAAAILSVTTLLPQDELTNEIVGNEVSAIDENVDRPRGQAAALAEADSEVPGPARPELAATVVRVLNDSGSSTSDSSKSDNSRFREGAAVFAGERIEVREQIVELETVNGAALVLEGPVTAEINSFGEVSLLEGKLAALNEGAEAKLVVRTPVATVVDVGTEFGVDATDKDLTSVTVYEGAVEVASGPLLDDQGREARVVVNERDRLVASVDDQSLRSPMPFVHDREFVRLDELTLRIDKQNGSEEAAEQVAFIDILRVEGLLAFQGFHAGSGGEAFSIGFTEPPVASAGAARFGPDLGSRGSVLKSSASLAVTNGDSLFLNLDVSDASPWFQNGLVDSRGMLGTKPGEIWLHWVAKIGVRKNTAPDWIGVSVMRNRQRDIDEPLFVGRPHLFDTFGSQAFGNADDRQQLDFAPGIPGVQPRAIDGDTHRWIVRFQCEGNGKATASVWCDVDPGGIPQRLPHSTHEYDDIEFDRLRFEASSGGDRGTFYFDDVIIADSPQAIAAVLQRIVD